jgi:hypothetical protein
VLPTSHAEKSFNRKARHEGPTIHDITLEASDDLCIRADHNTHLPDHNADVSLLDHFSGKGPCGMLDWGGHAGGEADLAG